MWNEQVERSFYKALDTNGLFYKNQEKNNFSTKALLQEAEEGIKIDFSDLQLVDDIAKIFKIFIKISQTDNKKAAIPNLYPTVDTIFGLVSQECSFIGDFNIFCVYRFIFYAYEKLKEIKNMDLKPICSSKLAVKMNIIPEYDVEDRFLEILNLIKSFCEKSIDSLDYEETVRILTNCRGFTIYNIKKIFLKIEKSIIAVIENEDSLNALLNKTVYNGEEAKMLISFENNIFSASFIQDATEKYEVEETNIKNTQEL